MDPNLSVPAAPDASDESLSSSPPAVSSELLVCEFEEQVEGWSEGLIRVARVVSFFDEEWQERSVEEFAAALLRAKEGLSDARVDAQNFYESIQVRVVGLRAPSAAELAEQEHREYRMWLAAKVRYEEGLARDFASHPPAAPLWTIEP